MTDTSKEMTVFYAWQSDSASSTNRNAIHEALILAKSDLEERHPGLIIRIDEATRDMIGSDNVPDSIRAKIEAADIFVGDVTTITLTPSPAEKATRPCPNPNVTFEVGYAAAHLGWQRLILLINTAIAKHDQLPFDFDRQRVSAYHVTSATDKSGKGKLKELAIAALNAIIENKPPRPAELLAASPAEIRRRRDVDTIREALSLINIPILEQHILDLPYQIDMDKSDYFYDFNAFVSSNLFHVNDNELDSAFRELNAAWVRALAPSNNYHANNNRQAFFSNPGDAPRSDGQQKDWDQIEEARAEMSKQLQIVLDIVRRKYVEIDVTETSCRAYEAWRIGMVKLYEKFRPPAS